MDGRRDAQFNRTIPVRSEPTKVVEHHMVRPPTYKLCFSTPASYNKSCQRDRAKVRQYKPMPIDLKHILKDLYSQRERLDHVIASLEALHKGTTAELPGRKKSNRGRKSMGADERLEVSERMRKYWEARRKKKILAAG